MYVGLQTVSVGLLKERVEKGSPIGLALLYPLFYTVLFAGIWWMNEVYAVRKLERMRAQVTSGIEGGEAQC